MKKRTANIILVCKGHHDFESELTLKQAVAHYMSKTCACPLEVYTDNVLRGIVFEAFIDYMSSCTCPREILYNIKEVRYWCDWSLKEDVDDITAILIGFKLCQVRDEKGFVNGFSEELINEYQLTESFDDAIEDEQSKA